MKALIFAGIIAGSTIGGWLGASLAHGNWLSGWSILLSAGGALAGVWAGYKTGQYLGV